MAASSARERLDEHENAEKWSGHSTQSWEHLFFKPDSTDADENARQEAMNRGSVANGSVDRSFSNGERIISLLISRNY